MSVKEYLVFFAENGNVKHVLTPIQESGEKSCMVYTDSVVLSILLDSEDIEGFKGTQSNAITFILWEQ